jgi:hypothetical protein
MNFIEFLEAFARVAEKYSPLGLLDNPSKISLKERIN